MLFRKKKKVPHEAPPPPPQPLRIEGIPEAPFTPEPDDAELAAQAVLEQAPKPPKGGCPPEAAPPSGGWGAGACAYYRTLASRIREAHAKAAQQATRFIYNCELMLQNRHLPLYGDGSVQMLETELYKRIDVVEREGGGLKRRWQHCLAEVTVRLMNTQAPEEKSHTDGTESTEKKDVTQKAQRYAERFDH